MYYTVQEESEISIIYKLSCKCQLALNRLFRILYAGFAGLNEFLELSALSHSPKMFAVNICIQNPIEPLNSDDGVLIDIRVR